MKPILVLKLEALTVAELCRLADEGFDVAAEFQRRHLSRP